MTSVPQPASAFDYPPTPHSPVELVALLLGCYEQLRDIPSILDAIIQGSQSVAPQMLSVRRDFETHVWLAQSRQAVFSTFRSLYPTVIRHTSERLPRQPRPPIRQIIDSFALGLRDNLSTREEQMLRRIASYYRDLLPAVCFPSPASSLLACQSPCGRRPLCRGLASNWKQLFILFSDQVLYVFGLANGGALGGPIERQIAVTLSADCSLIAGAASLCVHSGRARYEFNIADVLAGNRNRRPEFPFPIPLLFAPTALSPSALTARGSHE
jgi:hypothetical protein